MNRMSNETARRAWLDSLFASVDAKDTQSFLGFLTDTAVFRFGSAPPVRGRADIAAAVDEFFESIGGCGHTVNNSWYGRGTAACEGEVCYRRHDGSEITLPFANVFELEGDLISSYRIYIDAGPLYAS